MPAAAAIFVNNPSPALEISEESTYTLVKEESTKNKNELYLLHCDIYGTGCIRLHIYIRTYHQKSVRSGLI